MDTTSKSYIKCIIKSYSSQVSHSCAFFKVNEGNKLVEKQNKSQVSQSVSRQLKVIMTKSKVKNSINNPIGRKI